MIPNAVKIQQNLQELEKVTRHYCQPNPAWRQAEEEEFLHNLMMNLPKQKREKYQINVAIQPTGWCLGFCGIQQLPLWQASPILSLSISPLKDRLLWYCILPFTCLWAHCSETVKSKVPSIWFEMKKLRFPSRSRAKAEMSLRGRGRGFPLANTNVFPGYFQRKIKEK